MVVTPVERHYANSARAGECRAIDHAVATIGDDFAILDEHVPFDRRRVGLSATPSSKPVEQTHDCYYRVRRIGTIPIVVGDITIDIDPTLLRADNFPLQVTWHGFFTAVGTLVGIWLAVRWAVRAGYTEDDTFTVAMWGVIGAIIGARIFNVIDQWDVYARDPVSILKINEGGLAIYGTIIGGPIAGGIYAWYRGLNVPKLADVAAAPMAAGMAIGRIGDIINGEHHGTNAEGFPLAVVYTNPNTLGQIGLPVHPAAAYEMVLDLIIFIGLVWLARGIIRRRNGWLSFYWRPRTPRDGMMFWIFLGAYSIGRFVIQFYRQDSVFALGLSQAQFMAIVCTMVAVWALVFQYQRYQRYGVLHAPAMRPSSAPQATEAPPDSAAEDDADAGAPARAETTPSAAETQGEAEVSEHAPAS
jgi:prolipoprotein diacylglyceryl transferase